MSLSYVYKRTNLLESVKDVLTNQVVATYAYNNNMALTSTTYPNGTASTYTYNNANMLTNVTNKKGSTIAEKFDYTYYLDGNQASKIGLNNQVTNYVYDKMGRLSKETINGADTTYEYDDYGNRKTMATPDDFHQYTYNKNNWLLKETSANKAINYTYDNNGNLYSKYTETYSEILQ